MKKAYLKCMVALLLFVSGPLRAQQFSEIAQSLGIDITFGTGVHGGGVSFADFNGDGSDDLTFTSSENLPLYFYQNNGNGSFTSVNLVTNTDHTKEAIWVDYDNDGDQDLFVTAVNAPNRLYQNQGGMNMVDVTLTAFGQFNSEFSFGACFGDYDRDGWLDLYVCNYSPSGTEYNALYRNNANGTFTNLGTTTPVNNGTQLSFDAFFFDYNDDNWPDLYVINDRYMFSNALYQNQLGTFAGAPGAGADIAINAMNAGGADYDDDGDIDLYITNTSEGNAFLRNNGGSFTDVAASTGTVTNYVCWAANFFDYDNDQDQDLYVSALNFLDPNHANPFYVNENDGTFSWPLAATGGLGGNDVGRSYGHAMGDLNNDGRLDIAVSQQIDNNLVWRNDQPAVGNYVRFRLVGTTSNRDGIGAKIEADVPGKTMMRARYGSMGYISQHSQSLHFGLGAATSISQLRVYWPSGIVDTYDNFTNINQLVGLTEGETVLPLTLLDFSAKIVERDVVLNWTSEREEDFSHFVIQRSSTGERFESLGRVNGSGVDGRPTTYDFVDGQPLTGTAYYRLRMVDLDGSFVYSPLRTVHQKQPGNSGGLVLLRSPANPATGGRISFTVSVDEGKQLDAILVNSSGQKMVEKTWLLATGPNELSMKIDQVGTDQYTLVLLAEDERITIPLVHLGN